MTNSVDIYTQLGEISVELATRVAELLAVAARRLPDDKQRVVEAMINDKIPLVISNTLAKTTALHSTRGVDHLRSNLDSYAENFAQQILSQGS
jgi:hydroxypyruvate isomerase